MRGVAGDGAAVHRLHGGAGDHWYLIPRRRMIRVRWTGCLWSIVISVLLTVALNLCIRAV
jgi:hypothetical protein